ncbi:YybS family protein [Virgibacillus proomii]|uniref:YybS family protein n=1 Tax=Virgibacillus proomii TaxID=84407 RepID=UPI001C0F8A84|nr:YybS family protein [Virgibacillus proomii]MBU5265909.1 YybS family protein [Virgibacillus proomii]
MGQNPNKGMKDVEEAPNYEEQRKNQDFIGVKPDSSRDEEFATEMTTDDYEPEVTDDEVDANTTFGWIGIALSIISFFVWPVIFGVAGIVLGFMSRGRGADALGNIAIAAGVISILIALFILPFV